MHTHHGSGQMFLANGLNVLLFLTFWRLAWHAVASRTSSPTVHALARAAFVQAG